MNEHQEHCSQLWSTPPLSYGRKEAAVASAEYLKNRNPPSEVAEKDLRRGEGQWSFTSRRSEEPRWLKSHSVLSRQRIVPGVVLSQST
jgi:hypothetical protein